MPRGCLREFRKYQTCSANNGSASCTNEKINIMEVCPTHVLEGLRERRKWTARATAIDNATYKRAMEVSDYNRGRSVSDLKLKTWAHGTRANMRTDTMWDDDRYVPTKYPHNHKDDNVHNPAQLYTDLFGGNKGEAEIKENEKYALDFAHKESVMINQFKEKAMNDEMKQAEQEKINALVAAAKAHDEKK